MKKLFANKSALLLGLIMIAISLILSILLGALFASLGHSEKPWLERMYISTEFMFWLFGAAGVAAGVLVIVLPAVGEHFFGFGCALYYGTIVVSMFLNDFIITSETNLLIISFILVALVCYIYWLKFLKPSDT